MQTFIERYIEQGKQQGMEWGLERGRHEGQATLLLRLIDRKFGTPSESGHGARWISRTSQAQKGAHNPTDRSR